MTLAMEQKHKPKSVENTTVWALIKWGSATETLPMLRNGARATLFLLAISALCSCTLSMPNFKVLEEQGQAYAMESVERIGEKWDSQQYTERASTAMKGAGDPAQLFKIFSSTLGPLKKIDSIHRENYNEFAGVAVNRPDYIALYKCEVECESAPATVLVGAMHLNNQWSLSAFNVDSKALDELNKEDRAGSRKYVEELMPSLCSSLSIDIMRNNADANLAAELKNNVQNMAATALFSGIGKALGKFKQINEIKAAGFSINNGQFYYNYAADAEYERGKARISMVVVKQDGKWRLRGFNIQAHS